MKTKITYLAALVCALILAPSVLADTEEGFYEKNHIRGFVSIGGDYRGMFDEFRNYVNQVAFSNGYHVVEDESGSSELYAGQINYSKFDDYYLGLHVNIGAQYKQFLTWFDINFMPTQISERPSSTYTAVSDSGYGMKFPLYDVRWFCYGADWMFGWKLLGEDMPVNLIPAVGFGFNLINFHFASNFDLENEDGSYTALRDRYYSTIASTFNAELEIRLELGQFAIGAYGGYRAVRYNELNVEGERLETALGKYDTDNIGDTWFIGLRLTWIFLSDWQEKQNDKL
ncbi:MAG: hypothetical protein IKX42_07470 [Fibrobacter sp.]|nr:hypothetical protein [Fibrobacter sp.]